MLIYQIVHSIKALQNLLVDDFKLCRIDAHSAWDYDLCICSVRLRIFNRSLSKCYQNPDYGGEWALCAALGCLMLSYSVAYNRLYVKLHIVTDFHRNDALIIEPSVFDHVLCLTTLLIGSNTSGK